MSIEEQRGWFGIIALVIVFAVTIVILLTQRGDKLPGEPELRDDELSEPVEIP